MNWDIILEWVGNDTIRWMILISAAIGATFLLLKTLIVIFRILRERRRLTRQIYKIVQSAPSKKERIDDIWTSFEIDQRTKQVTSIPPGMLERTSSEREELVESLSSIKPSKRDKRFEIVGPADWPFWIVWKFIYLFLDLVRLLSPFHSRRKLEIRLTNLRDLEQRYEKHINSFNDLREFSTFDSKQDLMKSEEQARVRLENLDLERKKEKLQALKERGERNLDYLDQRLQNALEVGETPITYGSDYLDFGSAISSWRDRLEELKQLEEEGEKPIDELFELYQLFFENFEPIISDGGGKISTVELCAKDVARVEESIYSIKEAIQQMMDVVGQKVKMPVPLSEAESLLKNEISQHWVNLEGDEFLESIAKVKNLVKQARNTQITLYEWASLLLPLRDKAKWLKEMEDVTTDIHKISVEDRSDWTKAMKFLENQAFKLWAKLDTQKLEENVGETNDALRLRQQMLATRVSEQIDKIKIDPSSPKEAVDSLRELQRTILQGPDDKKVSLGVAVHGPIVISGEAAVTEIGTIMLPEYQTAWEGTDAIEQEEEEDLRPGPLNAIRKASERYKTRFSEDKE